MSINRPFVSICTPTFNRRPFINSIIACFNNQDYPKDRIEWLIADDGTDKVEDLFLNIPQVKYFYFSKKLCLGEKRNFLHDSSKGDIIVYMDDDDYYPPERVSHAVHMLETHPDALCAGSELYIYFNVLKKMYKFGPYGLNHATAGTFAFKRELLLRGNRYDSNASIAEEKAFLLNYTIPMVRLDPLKTILVFSHDHNTFDKRKLLGNPDDQFVKETSVKVEDFIKEQKLKDFYLQEMDVLLADYSDGKPEMKPDVIKQIREIEIDRKERLEKQNENNKKNNNKNIILKQDQGPPKILTIEQILHILKIQEEEIFYLKRMIAGKDNEIKLLLSSLDK
jgi:glycosyltransferase involved in cell wall biosynthesis